MDFFRFFGRAGPRPERARKADAEQSGTDAGKKTHIVCAILYYQKSSFYQDRLLRTNVGEAPLNKRVAFLQEHIQRLDTTVKSLTDSFLVVAERLREGREGGGGAAGAGGDSADRSSPQDRNAYRSP